MGLFTRKKIKNEATSTSNERIVDLRGWNDIFGVYVDDAPMKSATFMACMQIRCNSLAKLPLKTMVQNGDSVIVDTKHALYALLHNRPNPFMTSHDLLFLTEYDRIAHGNAFWYPVTNNRGRVTAIYPLKANKMSIIIDDEGVSDNDNKIIYQYMDSKLGTLTFKHDEICHFKSLSLNGFKGTPIMNYIADIVQSEKTSHKMYRKRLENGLQDPVIVQYIGDLNSDRKVAIQKKFATMGGSQNAGKVIPIPTDFKVSQLETKMVSSQFFEMQGLTSRHIANVFGVKSFQLNDLEKSTYTNIENQNRAYYSDTLMNVIKEYEQELTEKLFTKKEKQLGYFIQFNTDAFLRADPETRMSNYATGISNGIYSVAEVRKMEDLPHIDGTDDLIFGNGAAIKINQIGIQYGAGAEDSLKGGDNNDQISKDESN